MPDASGSIDLSSLSSEEQDAVTRLADERGGEVPPEQETEKPPYLTAFMVLVDITGNPNIMAVQDPNIKALAPPTPDLVYGAAQVICKDRLAEESAMATAEIMQQQAVQMMEAQRNAALQRQVSLDPRRNG